MHDPLETTEHLIYELERVLSGQPWYGRPVYDIVESASFDVAYEKPGNGAHTVAEIVLHMLAWTEEAIDRLNGKTAGEPTRGDWPRTDEPDEEKWQQLINDLKLANVDLIQGIRDFPADKWMEPINDNRNDEPVTSYEGLIYGFIQHQVYHAGQIALLTRVL